MRATLLRTLAYSLVLLAVATGGAMALGVLGDAWLPGESRPGFETGREIGVGLFTGGFVGLALLIIEQSREAQRERRDRELAAVQAEQNERLADAEAKRSELIDQKQRRHALAVALTVKEHLDGLTLVGQDLRGVTLRRRSLKNADLSHADLSGADLRGADLSGAILSDATLDRARLDGANLTGVNIRGASLVRASISEATWCDVFALRADLRGARISHSKLDLVRLCGADLTGATMEHLQVHRSDFEGCDLTATRMFSVNFRSGEPDGPVAGELYSQAELLGLRFGQSSDLFTEGRNKLFRSKWRGATLNSVNFSELSPASEFEPHMVSHCVFWVNPKHEPRWPAEWSESDQQNVRHGRIDEELVSEFHLLLDSGLDAPPDPRLKVKLDALSSRIGKAGFPGYQDVI